MKSRSIQYIITYKTIMQLQPTRFKNSKFKTPWTVPRDPYSVQEAKNALTAQPPSKKDIRRDGAPGCSDSQQIQHRAAKSAKSKWQRGETNYDRLICGNLESQKHWESIDGTDPGKEPHDRKAEEGSRVRYHKREKSVSMVYCLSVRFCSVLFFSSSAGPFNV